MTNRFIVLSVVIWQLVIIFCTVLSVRYLPLRDKFFGGMELAGPLDPNPFLRNPALYSRANFDGIHYINIARGTSVGVSQQAFFPLYVKLIAFLGPVLKNHNTAGVVISLTSFILGSFIFAKLLTLDYPSSVSRWIYLTLIFFPTSYYFSFVYTEGLFFLLSIAAFYFARTKRWWLAGLIGALASYTRITGIILFPALLIELFSQSHYSFSKVKYQSLNIVAVCLIPLGLLFFMWQLNYSAHDPLAFLHVQATFAQGRTDRLVLLPQVFWRYLKIFASFNRSDPLFFTIILEFVCSLIFLILNIYALFKLKLSYSVFSLTSYLLPTLTGTFTSMPRYVLACFPVFIIIGKLLSRTKPVVRYAYLGLSMLFSLFYLSLFVRGFWVS